MSEEFNTEEQEILFTIQDEQGVEHTLRLLTIFTAGQLGRQYVAGMTTDVMLYRCENTPDGSMTYVSEMADDEEFSRVSQAWSALVESGLEEADISEQTVYMHVLSGNSYEDIMFDGTVYSVFKLDEQDIQQYMAICPHNIMFFRYNLVETDYDATVEITNIYSPQEYEDVTAAFHNLIEE